MRVSNDWDRIEEREKEIAAVKVKERPKKAGRYESGWWRLYQSFKDQRLIMINDLKTMVHGHYDQAVVSVYLNLDPEKIKREDKKVYLSVFDALIHEEKQRRQVWLSGLDRRQKQQLNDDIKAIREYLEKVFEPEGLKSLVLYKSGNQLGFKFGLKVRLHHRDRVVIDVDPYILPLVAVLSKHPRVLSVFISKDDAVFYRLQVGEWEKIEKIRSFTPDEKVDHARPGKVWRNRLSWLHRHYKKAAGQIKQLFYEEDFDGLILIGAKETLKEFREFISPSIEIKIIGTHEFPGQLSESQLKEISLAVLEGYIKEKETKEKQKVSEVIGQGQAVTGLKGVIEAVNRFLVKRLWIKGDQQEKGWVCRKHHFLAIEKGTCPYCGKNLNECENVFDELIEMAQMYHVDYFIFDYDLQSLKPYEGVVAEVYKV